jgi:hypothetical protein
VIFSKNNKKFIKESIIITLYCDFKKITYEILRREYRGLMPKWTAGKLDGEKARVPFTLPVKFKLE